MKLIATLIFLLALTPHQVFSDSFQSHNEIISVIKELIETSLHEHAEKDITIKPLDNRLLLKKCGQKLVAFIPEGTKLIGNSTIGVRCNGKKPWKLFVSVNISLFSDVVVAAENITRGDQILRHQVKTEKQEISSLSRGYFETIDKVVGKIAKFPIYKNNTIFPSSVTNEKLVKRGSKVIILARYGQITVRMHGKAIADGALGETIKIKNIRSQKIIYGRVIDNNYVEVTM